MRWSIAGFALIAHFGAADAQTAPVPAIRVPELIDLPGSEIVNPERPNAGSLSFGTTSDGHLLDAEELGLEGTGFYVLSEHRTRGTDWGSSELVGLIRRVGERLATAEEGLAVGLGNMAVRGGGDIQWSRSHNNGRDVDLAFMFCDADGDFVEPDDLYLVRRDLTVANRPGVFFDPERNWLLVDALASDREANIQWLFIASFLEEAIVEWARDEGIAEGRINAAALLMHQPGDSLPHDDHLHVRIHCSDEDRLDGCLPYGPDRAGVDVVEPRLAARAAELARCATAERGDRCLEFLDELWPVRHVGAVLEQLDALGPADAMAVLNVAMGWGSDGFEDAALSALAQDLDSAVVLRLYTWLAANGDEQTAQAIAELVHFDLRAAGKLPHRAFAADALAELRAPIAVPALIAWLDDPRVAVRRAAATALEMTTGVGTAVDDDSPVERAIAEAEWAAWFAARGAMSRPEWLSLAFEEAGYDVGAWSDPNVEALVAATTDSRPGLRTNAVDRLNTLTGGACENPDGAEQIACWRRRLR